MSINAPYGRLITAMVTPFTKDGAIDWKGVEVLANHLVSTGHDGIVLNGTTGEAPTTSDEEKVQIIKVVRDVQRISDLARRLRDIGANGDCPIRQLVPRQ